MWVSIVKMKRRPNSWYLFYAACLTWITPKAWEIEIFFSVSGLFEVMKNSKRGKHGHIALQTPDVELAMADLARKGISFQEDTIRRNADGKIIFVYLKEDIGGFSFHLTE